jgi:aminopeptidase N
MGAMENKGLNIFNTKYVLASPATATDTDFADRERGRPRVLPQLDRQPRHLPRLVPVELKEGLTVFRDQEFSPTWPARRRRARRQADRRRARAAPDAVPRRRGSDGASGAPGKLRRDQQLLHATVYEKGSEVVRMYQTLVGRAGFRAAWTCTSGATTARP